MMRPTRHYSQGSVECLVNKSRDGQGTGQASVPLCPLSQRQGGAGRCLPSPLAATSRTRSAGTPVCPAAAAAAAAAAAVVVVAVVVALVLHNTTTVTSENRKNTIYTPEGCTGIGGLNPLNIVTVKSIKHKI